MSEVSGSYREAGVDIKLGDELSSTLYEAAKMTWSNREDVFGKITELSSNFSGFRAMPAELLGKTQDMFLGMSDDGVGTKVEVAERMEDHRTVAFDLFAMVCDDAVVRGAEPVAVTTTLDVRKLDNTLETQQAILQLAEGYVRAAEAAGVAVINGEVAELGARIGGYGEFNYNWSATVLWAVHKERILDGSKLQPGDRLIGLREKGFRSNGLSLARKNFQARFGDEWHTESLHDEEDNTLLDLGTRVQLPSTIYSKAIVKMTGGYDLNRKPHAEIHGIAHITGGGLPGKLGRMLKTTGLGAIISNPWRPCSAMLQAQSIGHVSDFEAYQTWNMGQGMVVATSEPERVLSVIEAHNIEAKMPIEAKIIGEVSNSTSDIWVKSYGQEKPGSILTFPVN